MSAADRRARVALRLTAAAIVWSVGLLIAALTIAAYHGQTESSSTDGLTITSRTLVQVHGLGALVLVLLPVLASAAVAATLWRTHRDGDVRAGQAAWGAVAALTVVAILGITSLGAMMIPVAALLAASARLVAGPPPLGGLRPSRLAPAAQALRRRRRGGGVQDTAGDAS